MQREERHLDGEGHEKREEQEHLLPEIKLEAAAG